MSTTYERGSVLSVSPAPVGSTVELRWKEGDSSRRATGDLIGWAVVVVSAEEELSGVDRDRFQPVVHLDTVVQPLMLLPDVSALPLTVDGFRAETGATRNRITYTLGGSA